MKKVLIILLSAILIFALAACSKGEKTTDSNTTTPNNSTTSDSDDPSNTDTNSTTDDSTVDPGTTETDSSGIVYYDEADQSVTHPDFTKADLNAKWNSGNTKIKLNGTTATVTGKGATVNGNVVKITQAGTYVVSGTFTNGRIEVEVTKNDNVQIVLNGAKITCNNYAPISVKAANKTIITLVKNTVNTLTDGSQYTLPTGETKPNATLYSADDLTINGTGKLVVNAFYNNGIGTNNDLKIVSGTIEINASKNALKGNDSIFIIGGTIKLECGNDAIKSDEEVKEGKGFVQIEGGNIDVVAGGNGIQATNRVTVKAGQVKINSVKSEINCDKVQDITPGTVTFVK